MNFKHKIALWIVDRGMWIGVGPRYAIDIMPNMA